MFAIKETAAGVRLQCEACGAHTTLRRFERERVGIESEWLDCRVCGTRSKLVEQSGMTLQPALPARA